MQLQIKNKIYTTEDVTLRQNKAFIKLCAEQKIHFLEVDSGIDIGSFLMNAANGDVIEQILAIILHEEGTIWKPHCNDDILKDLSELTEDVIEKIISDFFVKKKAWIAGLMNVLQSYLMRLLITIGKKKK